MAHQPHLKKRRGRSSRCLFGVKDWRPRPESNRGARICSPLRNHSATRPSPLRYQRAISSTRRAPSRTANARPTPDRLWADRCALEDGILATFAPGPAGPGACAAADGRLRDERLRPRSSWCSRWRSRSTGSSAIRTGSGGACRTPSSLMGWAIDWLDGRLNHPGQRFRERPPPRDPGARARRRAASARSARALASLLLAWLPLGWAIEAIVVAILLAQKSLVDHVAAVARALGQSRARRRPARPSPRSSGATCPCSTRRASRAPRSNRPRRIFPTASSRRPSGISLLGLPGLLVYKIVNTADSMIGNRSPRYDRLRLGGGAARRPAELRSGAALGGC